MNIGVLKPQCMIKNKMNCTACLGHSAAGYLTPCCWIDAFPEHRGIAQDIFYQQKFLISNNKSIKDITQSQEWIDFYTLLWNEPDKAPPVCHKMCDEKSIIDNYGD